MHTDPGGVVQLNVWYVNVGTTVLLTTDSNHCSGDSNLKSGRRQTDLFSR